LDHEQQRLPGVSLAGVHIFRIFWGEKAALTDRSPTTSASAKTLFWASYKEAEKRQSRMPFTHSNAAKANEKYTTRGRVGLSAENPFKDFGRRFEA
jgi:hypothetical protein